MKKLPSTWQNMLLVLTLISVLAGGALAYVNSITEDPIREIKQKQLGDGIKAVLNAQSVEIERVDTLAGEKGEAIAYIYHTDRGYAVQTYDKKAFAGTLSVLVGFNKDGYIEGYRVMETQETPGLGAKAQEWFQKGAKGDVIGKRGGNLKVTKDGGEVDAITASTITSRAFLNCVNDAYRLLKAETVDAQSGASRNHNPKASDAQSGASRNHRPEPNVTEKEEPNHE